MVKAKDISKDVASGGLFCLKYRHQRKYNPDSFQDLTNLKKIDQVTSTTKSMELDTVWMPQLLSVSSLNQKLSSYMGTLLLKSELQHPLNHSCFISFHFLGILGSICLHFPLLSNQHHPIALRSHLCDLETSAQLQQHR